MERIIRIDEFSNAEKKDKSGTFPRFKCLVDNKETLIGVFEKDVEASLKSNLGRWVKVVAPRRPNGYINITHFVSIATEEEIPNFSEKAKVKDAVQVGNLKSEESDTTGTVGTYIVHELIDNRIIYNKYEFGSANDRHTIKYKDVEDFKQQYEEIIEAKRVIDAKLNPKQ